MFSRIKRLVSAYHEAQSEPDCLDFLDSLYQNDENLDTTISFAKEKD